MALPESTARCHASELGNGCFGTSHTDVAIWAGFDAVTQAGAKTSNKPLSRKSVPSSVEKHKQRHHADNDDDYEHWKQASAPNAIGAIVGVAGHCADDVCSGAPGPVVKISSDKPCGSGSVFANRIASNESPVHPRLRRQDFPRHQHRP
jgi:hypothetical protein